MSEDTTPESVLRFWFGKPATTPEELGPQLRRWFMGGSEMDAEVRLRFADDVHAAMVGRRDEWLSHPKGWLALILLLDQFTRNVLRDSPRMYDGDARAQALAVDALDSGRTHALPIGERHFALMPLIHAESLASQERGVVELVSLVEAAPPQLRPLYSMGIEQSRKYRDIIARFGRFPHRNAILGRASTAEELDFLKDWEEKRAPAGAHELPQAKPS